jgi:hypothetical protein
MKKRNFAMNKIKAIAFGAIIFALLACEQPFKAGLGPVVDIRDPTLTLDRPGAGSYIHGEMPFSGTAEDDYILSRVEIKVTNRPNAVLDGKPYLQEYTEVPLFKSRQNNGVWNFTLITRQKIGNLEEYNTIFPEGDLKIRLKVTDSVGKWSETDEIVFQVKNESPAISLTAPNIKRARDDEVGEVGGPHLNFYAEGVNPNTLPSSISYPRRVDKKTYLTGTITDDQGIYTGPVAGKKFPPQYRFWQVVESGEANGSSTFAPGYLPTEGQVGWTAFDQQKSELIALTGAGNYMFAYELPDTPGVFYGLEIRACSIDNESTTFHYPLDYYPLNYFENPGSAPSEWARIENRYVLIYIKAPEATPVVDFYALEDIFGTVSGGSFTNLPGVDNDHYHPYVNDLTVNKNGAFTLRVKASHQEGILRAEVYWQKEGSTDRGRFIWDLANAAPPRSSDWNMSNTVSATQAYSMWGYVDQISDKTRNFVFTYKNDGNDRIPAGTGYNSLVQGKSKIQRYTPTGEAADTAWKNKHTAQFAWSTVEEPGRWEDMAKLEEGVYNIEVYATSASNTGMAMPATRTVRLDWVAPELEINKIEGEYGPANGAYLPSNNIADPQASVVNGVIELQLLISDSRVADSGIRTNRNPYFGGLKEQVFIVVNETDNGTMQGLIKDNWWPTLPADTNAVMELPDPEASNKITVKKHGIIAGNSFRLKTTKIYDTVTIEDNENEPLGNGDYRLYLFVRDNAFNVKSISKKLVVREASDTPRFNFDVGTNPMQMVTVPGFPNQSGAGGFYEGVSGVNPRNLLGANPEIKINIMDDDSLDLGVSAGDASGITINFFTSYQEPDGDVKANASATLLDARAIFGTQSVVQTKRLAVKNQTGTIEQKHFPLAVSNGGRLPDGVYKLEITVPDYRPLKLRLGTDPDNDPIKADAKKEFWFAVNDNNPVFNQTVTPPSDTATLDQLRDTGVKGTVSAANGPITVSYVLTKGQESTETRTLAPAEIPVVTSKLASGIWEVNFTAKLNLGTTPSGTYTLRLTATDRFGKSSVLPYQFTIDNDGPIITRRVAMQTVDRSSFYETAEGKLILAKNGLGVIPHSTEEPDALNLTRPGPNLKRLANEMVSVTLRAVDISGVKELRYWLLQDGVTLTVPAVVDGVWNVPTGLPTNSRYGFLKGEAEDYGEVTFTINLAGLASEKYHLYALALDNKNNITASRASLQTIYVEQKSDYPFFSDFALAGKAVSSGGAVISGTIYDDDGFQAASGGGLRANSIRVWMRTGETLDSDMNVTGDGDPTDGLPTDNGTYTSVIIPVDTNPPLSSIGNGKNIGVNINLQDYFPAMFTGDGTKHVIIQATDSPTTKLSPTNNDRKYRRQYFSFKYDNKAPEIDIESPGPGASFGGEVGSSTFNFELKGYIQDANLVTDGGGNYYFRYRLNDDVNSYDFPLKSGAGSTITYPTAGVPSGEKRVAFTITNEALIKELLYQTALPGILPTLPPIRPESEKSKLQEGNNTLWIIARDESGKETREGIKFFIDIKPPNTFLTLKEVKLEDIVIDTVKYPGFTWTPPAESAALLTWYGYRRAILDAYDVPIIQRAASGAFYITGTFVDDASNITRIFNYWLDNNSMVASVNADLTYLPNPPGTASKNASWRVNIASLPDGLHTIRLKPTDQYENGKGSTEYSKTFAFRINSGKPEVAITTTPAQNVFGRLTGQQATAEMFMISGTAKSSNLENVNLVIRHIDGNTFFSTDLVKGASNPNDTNITVNNWTFTGAGTVASPLSENLAWTLRVTRGNLNTAGGDNNLKEGTYEVAVVSSDMYGGESDEAIWTFTVDKSPPVISYSRLTAFTATAQTPYTLIDTPQQSKTLMGDNPTISGRIQDSLSNISAVQRQIRRYTYGTTATNGTWQFYNFTTNTWVTADGTTDATWATVTVPTGTERDLTVDWDLKSARTANGVDGGLGDYLLDGFYSIRLRARDTSQLVPSAGGWTPNGANGGTNNGNPFTSNYLYFFYANNTPNVEHQNNTQTTFSSDNEGKAVSLGITAAYANNNVNRFHTLEVNVETVNTGTATPPGPFTLDKIYRTSNGTNNNNWTTTGPWEPELSIPFAPANYPEGRYRVYFKVTDVAGRSTTINRVIYLDNAPPEGIIDEPKYVGELIKHTGTGATLYEYASEVRNGGEPLIINGTADDVSGLKEIWFHLGYGTKTSFPTPADAAEFWGDNPAAPQAGSAWFKYAPIAGVTGEGVIGSATNNSQFPYINFAGMDAGYLYKWSFTMTREAIEYYARASVSVNGRTYNNYATTSPNTPHATGPWMVRPIPDNDTIPNTYRKSGLYSLPLYVRIVDSAGNVEYIQRDIWIYPAGDYPSTTIINPSADTERGTPRGGQVSFEGMASDNVSVRRVIYRVKADREMNASDPSLESSVILPALKTIGQTPLDTYNDYANINKVYRKVALGITTDNPNDANNLAGKGWYVANLESQDYGQSVPWNFTLNANGEFDDIIKERGFLSTAPVGTPNPATNDTVRLWVEVYVFDDTAPRAEAFNVMSLGGGNKDSLATIKPFVRVLYLKSTSPKITAHQLSNKGTVTNFANYDRNNATRRGQFAIQARLSGSGSPIDQISVRLQQDTGAGLSGWRDAYRSGTSQNLNGISFTNVPVSGSPDDIIIRYQFDTATGTLPNTFQQVMAGAWAANGGRYTIDVRIRDNNSPPGQDMYTFEVGVDNYAPFADTVKQVTNTKVAGSNVAFMGRVFDYQGTPTNPTPPYRGIQEVRVWFTKGRDAPTATSTLINPNTGATTAGGTTTTTTSAWTTRTATINYASTGTAVTSIPTVNNGTWSTTVRYPTDANAYVKVLNETTAGVMDNRITWQPSQNHDIFWSFIANTIPFPDGWITMHYLVEDVAGNVSYYTQYMVVMNKYPQITDLVLFTNNTGTGAVFTTHPTDQAYSEYRVEKGYGTGNNRGDGTYLNSGFISKNSVIGFGVKTQAGTRNFPLHYQAQYVQRYRIPLTTANLSAMANNRGGIATTYNVGTVAAPQNVTGTFVNLYTIVNDTQLGSNTWTTLGVKEASPATGNHFVFQPSPAEVAGMNEPNAYVYAYRQVHTTTQAPTKAAVDRDEAQITAGDGDAVNGIRLDVHPNNLNYSGTGTNGYFESVTTKPVLYTKINEFKGSQPGKNNFTGNAGDYDPKNPLNLNYSEDTAFFIIKVWDSVAPTTGTNALESYEMLYDAIVVGMNVYLTDSDPPVARIYDLNPYTETAVSGNNLNGTVQGNTRNNAAAPRGIGLNILRGGLYNVKTERDIVKSGHIEPRNNSTALNAWYDERNDGVWAQLQPNGFETGDSNQLAGSTKDRVSGKVILRGKVWDNQLIDSISIQLGTAATATPILRLLPVNNTNGAIDYGNTQTTGYTKKMVPATAATTGVYAVEELHWQTGHTVEWAYIWDTEGSSAGATADYRVRISAMDNINPKSSVPVLMTEEVLPPNAKFHNDFTVDIVPYVVGFERQSQFATTRSLQGWYSFYRGETDIALLGYNLGGATTPDIRIRTAPDTTTAMTGLRNENVATRYLFPRRYYFTVPDATTSVSGKIEVTAGNVATGTPAYNHTSSHTNKSWNKESNAYTSGSELWINKPYAHIWRTAESGTAPATYFGNGTDSRNLSSPGMALEYINATNNVSVPGRLHAAWSIYGEANYYYGSNQNGNRIAMTATGTDISDPFVDPDISLFNGMYNGIGTAAATQDTANIVVVHQYDGLAHVALKTRLNTTVAIRLSDPPYATTGTGRPTQRWRNSRIAKAARNGATDAEGNAGRAYVTSYDSQFGNMWFNSRYNAVSNAYTIDGTPSGATDYAAPAITVNKTTASGGNLGTVTNAGEYSAVDYDQYGPVIAYYDQVNDTLRLAYGNITANQEVNNWGRQYVISDANHQLRKGSGKYVSIKVDRLNGIHLAFYNSNLQTVVYAYAEARTSGTATNAVFTFNTVHTVDNVILGGTWTDIAVDNLGNPWITYGDTSRNGNYDGVRMAYKSQASNAIATGAIAFTRPATPLAGVGTAPSITGWEAISMPANFTVNNDRLNIEAWPPTVRGGGTLGTRATGAANAWNAAIGYASDIYRVGYFYVPTFKENNTY